MAGSEPMGAGNLRTGFASELDQLRLQVEVMSLKVDEAVVSAATVLRSGDVQLAQRVIASDDQIDAMLVSLTERCYDLLCRQTPVASDLRLVVSVLRILSDLERIGDLCLRVVKLAPAQPLLRSASESFAILDAMAGQALELYRLATHAWSTGDLRAAHDLEKQDDVMDGYSADLMTELLRLEGPDAVETAINTLLAGRALERIADHAVMMGERLRYLLTGDAASLGKEIGP